MSKLQKLFKVMKCVNIAKLCFVKFPRTAGPSEIIPIADPGGAEARAPLPLLKLVKKKMAAAPRRKFPKSSGPPSDKFLDALLNSFGKHGKLSLLGNMSSRCTLILPNVDY